MSPKHLKSCIEGLLFAAGDEGLEARQLAAVLEQEEATVAALLAQMKKEFAKAGRGIQIVEVGGGYQLTTLPEHAPYFQRLASSPTRGTLSQASLETLAIVAYRQPITRLEIEEIRGVKSERAIHTLVSKDLVEAKGRSEAVGRPILYATTKRFMDYFGLRSMEDLPASSQFEHPEDLAEETRLLFEKLDQQALGEMAR